MMPVAVSAVVQASPSQGNRDEKVRRSANFHPSIWGDRFLSYSSDPIEIRNEKEHERLKGEVMKVLTAEVKQPCEKLELIDAVQRLGVSYHFEKEIHEILKQIYVASPRFDFEEIKDDNVHDVSLRFRLLRQQGFRASSDVFNKFKDEEGNYKKCLVSDLRGMLSLYEAAHLRIRGEDILEEALDFTTHHLESIATQLSPGPLASQITHALKQPLFKGIPRVETRLYIPIYEQDVSHNKILLNFAKLDFNLLQHLHRKGLSYITRWWKGLDFTKKLFFIRDRAVESYFWILGVYFEPQYLMARKIVTKVICLASVIDDIYDSYATIEELELFTDSIERWDISAMEQLPEYMKVCYQALLDVYAEIEAKLVEDAKLYRLHYAKEAMKILVRAYLTEARWYDCKYVPTLEEYMTVALVTCGYSMLTITSLVGMEEDAVTEHAFEWLVTRPKMLVASEIICRLMDDIVSHEFEQKRGHVASSVECYMKQYKATEAEAVQEFRRRISEAWKDVNEECLIPTAVPVSILTRILNFARVIDVVHKDVDGYTFPEFVLKDYVTYLLVDPLVV